jgi:hypothetical protein
MTIADEIRLATSRDRLHPLVRDNWASPRGLCNCSKLVDTGLESGVAFCQLDYGHEDEHTNGPHKWKATWPPPELHIRAAVKAQSQIEVSVRLDPEWFCGNCGAEVYFQREPGPCPQCGSARPITEGTSDVG